MSKTIEQKVKNAFELNDIHVTKSDVTKVVEFTKSISETPDIRIFKSFKELMAWQYESKDAIDSIFEIAIDIADSDSPNMNIKELLMDEDCTMQVNNDVYIYVFEG